MYNFTLMDINELTQAMDRFVAAKGWYTGDSPRPQTLKNLAASLCIEAAEVLELFQWVEQTTDSNALASELADVTLYLLQIARVAEIDLEQAVLNKLNLNYQRNWDQKKPDERNHYDEDH